MWGWSEGADPSTVYMQSMGQRPSHATRHVLNFMRAKQQMPLNMLLWDAGDENTQKIAYRAVTELVADNKLSLSPDGASISLHHNIRAE